MRRVFKYPLRPLGQTAHTTIEVPGQPTLAHVDMQRDQVCLWLEVEQASKPVAYSIEVVGTGHPVPDAYMHLGSVIDRQFVWHVYQDLRKDQLSIKK